MSYPWYRYYSETADDGKFVEIASHTGLPWLSVHGAWAILLAKANTSPIRGSLYVTPLKRYSNTSIYNFLGLDTESGDALLSAMVDFGMLEVDEKGAYRVCNFEKRQFTSDSSTERVKKHRRNVTETLQESYNDVPPSVVCSVESVNLNSLNSLTAEDQFEKMQADLEEITGLPIVGEPGVKAVNAFVEQRVSREDIQAAYDWYIGEGNTLKYHKSLLNPAIRRMRERLSKNHNDSTSDPYKNWLPA